MKLGFEIEVDLNDLKWYRFHNHGTIIFLFLSTMAVCYDIRPITTYWVLYFKSYFALETI